MTLLSGKARRAWEQVRRLLVPLELSLHREKTRMVRSEKGLHFLGVHFRLRPVRKKKAKNG